MIDISLQGIPKEQWTVNVMCPECRYGMNASTANGAHCRNCGSHWDADIRFTFDDNSMFSYDLKPHDFDDDLPTDGEPWSVEQCVRDIITAAIRDGVVALAPDEWKDPDPQSRSSGELSAPAHVLSRFLARSPSIKR